MKKILVLLLLVMLVLPCTALANTYPNEPDGFRDMKWGTEFETVKDKMIFSRFDPSGGGFNFYTRKDDDMTIDYAKLKKVEYGFWQGQFCVATITVNRRSNWSIVQYSLTDVFGEGHASKIWTDYYSWIGDETNITSEFQKDSNEGIFDFSYRKLLNKIFPQIK